MGHVQVEAGSAEMELWSWSWEGVLIGALIGFSPLIAVALFFGVMYAGVFVAIGFEIIKDGITGFFQRHRSPRA